jgi:TonB family protein
MAFGEIQLSGCTLARVAAFSLILAATCLVGDAPFVRAQTEPRPVTVAVLDFGESAQARTAAETLVASLKLESGIEIIDPDQMRAAVRGASYNESLNMSLSEARNLGAVLGADFFILGDAQTLRRSPSAGAVYFESYASIFLVSARSGRLITWARPNFRGVTAAAAEHYLLNELSNEMLRTRLRISLRRAEEDERAERATIIDSEVPVIEEAPDDDKVAAAEGLRLPKPYRRFLPVYPETAAAAEAEAMVDVLVDLDKGGEVTRAEVVRWAGFGLDQATLDTIHKLHFFPAMRDGVAVPIRVLLRYNFRKPPPQ